MQDGIHPKKRILLSKIAISPFGGPNPLGPPGLSKPAGTIFFTALRFCPYAKYDFKKNWGEKKVCLALPFSVNPILHRGIKSIPQGWLLCTNPQGMPQIGWFFMTLFLSTFERSWVSHFWGFFLKISKNFTLNFFFRQNPKEGPFYTCKNAFIFGSFFGSKMVIIQLQMHK